MPTALSLSVWQVFFFLTGHIPQSRIQGTVLQINTQDEKCLLDLILIQNVVFDQGEFLGLLKYQ